ncbi:hypothetical protein WPG_0144 [Winogradskyella sp. PG-2]|nr:hypothetical protein WPG_0144 [Winogradskyella sp. PG-2]
MVGVLFGGELVLIGLSFLVIAPFAQFFFYDLKNKNQYYYYYNLGFNNIKLWASTIIIGLINLLILILI